jgi:hypothetical protein
MEWTHEKPKEIGIYLRSNPALQKDISIQTVYLVDERLKTHHPQNDGGKLTNVEEMPDTFLWLKIPYPPHYVKSLHEIPPEHTRSCPANPSHHVWGLVKGKVRCVNCGAK